MRGRFFEFGESGFDVVQLLLQALDAVHDQVERCGGPLTGITLGATIAGSAARPSATGSSFGLRHVRRDDFGIPI